jgi:O-antigen ligase/polysaccharide polymerase Wzy-like membrane protein
MLLQLKLYIINCNYKLKALSIALLYGIMFSGKFSFERILDPQVKDSNLEIRYFLIIILIIIVFILFIRKKKNTNHKIDSRLLIVFFISMLFYIIILINLIYFGGNNIYTHLIDVLSIIIVLPLIIITFNRKIDLIIFSYISIIGGLFFFILAVLGLGDTGLNPGWAPFGGPITLYKIQFLAFCCALFLSSKTEKTVNKLFYYLLSTISLFCIFMTLSKAPVVGVFIALIFLIYFLFLHKKYILVLNISIILLISFITFYNYKGSLLVSRINAVGSFLDYKHQNKYQNKEKAEFEIIFQKFVINDSVKKISELNPSEKKTLDVVLDFLDADCILNRSDKSQISCIKSYLQYFNNLIILSDSSDRVKMLMYGIKSAKNNIIFGIGIAKYELPHFQRYKKVVEIYKYPHNIVVELFSAMGIMGVLYFCLWFVIVITILVKRSLILYEIGFFISLFIFLILISFFNGSYYDFRIVVFIPLIIISSLFNEKNDEKNTIN